MIYKTNSGRLSIAFCFSSSTARVYFSVCFNPLCPNRLATVLIFAPLFKIFTANECRPQCQVICFLIPARATQRFNALLHMVWLGRVNIYSSLLSESPIKLNKPSFRGITTPLDALLPFVFNCSNFNSRLE